MMNLLQNNNNHQSTRGKPLPSSYQNTQNTMIPPSNKLSGASPHAGPQRKPFMASTHQYYNSQHFWSKAEEEQLNGQGSGTSSPETAMSICMEDSFGDLVDNDTSERHIVVQAETPKKQRTQQNHHQSQQAYLPQTLMSLQSSNSGNHKQGLSKIKQGNKENQIGRLGSSKGSSGVKYSVAMPLPTNNGMDTPGQKSAKSNQKLDGLYDHSQNPKQLHFIDRIQEETTINEGNSISTGPSNSGLDLIVLGNPSQPSRQQKLNKHPLYRTNLYATYGSTKSGRHPFLDLKASKQHSGESVDVFINSARGQNEFHNKMEDFLLKKEEKIRKMREEKEQKEVEGCVFSPKLETRKAGEIQQRRAFEQFMQDQMRFVETVKQKREIRQEEQDYQEIAQIQHGPYLSTRSRQILIQRQQRTLSREATNDGCLSDTTGQHVNQMATPGSNLTRKYGSQMKTGDIQLVKKKNDVKRDRPVEEILYQDAKRRQASIETRQQEAIAKCTQIMPLISRESQKLVIQKFEREINANIYELFQSQKEVNIDEMLRDEYIQLPSSMNYLSMKLLMVRLGSCSEEQTFMECAESELLFEMWKFLSQDQHHTQSDNDLPTDRLKLFCMVILRVAEPKVLENYLANTEHGFNFEEAGQLIRKFEMFYINRLHSLTKVQMNKKLEMESLQTQGLPFKPQLSQNTIQLAQKKQTRLKPNHLMQSSRGAGVMQTFFNTKEAQEMQECTFKPTISDNSRKLSTNRRLIPPDNQGEQYPNDKCSELFEHAKQVNQAKQAVQDKTTEEVEYERSKEQCTFKPTIHQAPVPIPKPSKPSGGEFTKTHLDRQTRARVERERVREITERGYSSNRQRDGSANSRHQTQSVAQPSAPKNKPIRPATAKDLKRLLAPKPFNQDLRIPLLLVDIGIGNRKERIAVYEGDRADNLARDFCIRHGLDIENIAVRLQEEIERQIEMISMGSTDVKEEDTTAAAPITNEQQQIKQ